MSAKEVYTYTCAQHSLGVFVREVGAQELADLKLVGRPHFTNCWVKGCQMPLTQVRLVGEAIPSTTRASSPAGDANPSSSPSPHPDSPRGTVRQ